MALPIIPEEVKLMLKKQKYHIVGKHSAVKKCRWLHKSLTENKTCYKEKFYGISSHRCVQCTPSVIWCPNYCVYCWRVMPKDVGVRWDQLQIKKIQADEPEELYEGFIREQRRILTGYNPTHHKLVNPVKYREALDPKHFAISLSGEPLLYEKISELIDLIKSKDKTAFLVTNGQEPKKLSELSKPSQLYVSLSAPNEAVFKKTCKPSYRDGWLRLNNSIELLSSFKCPTALRLTLVKNLNTTDIQGYAKLIEKSNCTYVEVKAAMFVGGSQFRMNFNNMPRHSFIKDFSKRLSDLTSYRIIDEVLNSRVVLLSRIKKPYRFDVKED
ncbi:MAG: 4-demethylwyosine synthase TYW1 [Candidatus Odinarchaeia archaeon]